MKIIRDYKEITKHLPYACVTIGNFDGVHQAHGRIFDQVVSKAREHQGSSVVVTFDPHPLKILKPGGIKLISTIEQKIESIRMAGIDYLVILPFDRDFAATTAKTFVDEVLVGAIGVRELVVGYDYGFGRGREGNIDFLKQQGKENGFPVTVVEAHYEEDMLVSSTKIRELVTEGRMRDVEKLLGRYYQIRGEVQRGRQRGGSVVGFPTANLQILHDDLCPKHGVYVTQVIYAGKCYGGVSNIGYNPTFGEGKLVAETHIFDFDADIYGKPLKINLLKHLRGEKKFSGPEELAAQIRKDISVARTVLEEAHQELLITCSNEED
ncbi:MAG: bifunctional riboflavin kinase/FAD synthetase [Desulfobulbaceae bacterium]|nr:bifunctional riboflavin kinase/FAD synthetase [Desulfobulbaceae bacterium]